MSRFKAFSRLPGSVLVLALHSVYNCYMALTFLVSFWCLSLGNRTSSLTLGMVCTHLGGHLPLVLSITNALCLQDSAPDTSFRPTPGTLRKPGAVDGWKVARPGFPFSRTVLYPLCVGQLVKWKGNDGGKTEWVPGTVHYYKVTRQTVHLVQFCPVRSRFTTRSWKLKLGLWIQCPFTVWGFLPLLAPH